ncbi:MAG: ring-cleaving dioxygenase [Bacteroidales bacterium]
MIQGLHHITALTGNIRNNIRFYNEILGLRLIKRTVNYDSPDTWHLYFGDAQGKPGTVITFFPFMNIPKGQSGNGSVKVTGFSVGAGSLSFWAKRLKEYHVPFRGPSHRFDEEFLFLQDFDGLELELVASAKDSRVGTGTVGIKEEYAIKGFSHVELSLSSSERTIELLTGTLEHVMLDEEGERHRLFSGENAPGNYIDLVSRPAMPMQQQGSGTIHHVALGTRDEKTQEQLRKKIQDKGLFISEIKDRQYFKSIYFREPGGVLFEVATQGPGFMIDEQAQTLGQELKLPPWLENQRQQIEEQLPPLE